MFWRQNISHDPAGHKRLEVFVEVAVVVNHVHFLVQFLVLFQDLDRGRFGGILYHLVVDRIQVAA